MYTRIGPLLSDALDGTAERVSADLWLRFPPSFSAEQCEEFALAWANRLGTSVRYVFSVLDRTLRVDGPRAFIESLVEDPVVVLAMAPKADRDAAGVTVPAIRY